MENHLVRDVVAEVLEAVRPEELLILDAADPATTISAPVSGGPMGLGVSMAAALVAPIVWKIVESLAGDFLKEGTTRTAKLAVDFFAKKFDTSDPNQAAIQIAAYASKELESCEMPADEREVIAWKIAEVLADRLKIEVA